MEIRILHSILHTSLMPWTFDSGNTKSITEKLKKVGSKEPAFESELIQQLKVLLADYPELLQWLDKQNTQSPNPLRAHLFTTQLPAYTNNSSKFYWQVINKEALRVLNAYCSRSKKWSNKVDVIYHTNLLLKSIKALTQQTVKEIEARGLEELPNEQSDLVHYVLHLLKQELIVLYFDIQELSKHSLDTIISLEDFYLTELNLPLNRMQPLHIALQTEVPADKTPVHLLEQFKLENQEIERIEVALRELVLKTYAILTLRDFRRVVPSNIQNKVNEALGREEKKNPALINPKRESPEYLIQFTDLQELQVVFTMKSNWDSVQHLFGTKETLTSEFNNLSGLRNAIRHSRNVDEITLLKGQAAIKWFNMQLRFC
ncbi:hypothetical protein J2T02_000883 [Chitinophaga terrae (ex Kim and Jung 2007)]|uniref:hypothetical protein n=1 Tax=Chitinophaga terrae (ex Kim and Jung 2007) TaxID=408074 RepID=UPI0027820348|nr:hypothetical protein [Chitinophaga terrae (ex Kim and Jung 2007)]MDQ0105789.1 hypothetical protein [Chitinophaga terrae (ex Kim and Jung 2007)]